MIDIYIPQPPPGIHNSGRNEYGTGKDNHFHDKPTAANGVPNKVPHFLFNLYQTIFKQEPMNKPANTSQNIHPIIKNRWSPRAFDQRPIKEETLRRIMEAARWAPSSFNEQPWRFVLGIKGDETWNKLHEVMVEFNQKWAGNAPVLLLAIGKTTSAKGGENAVFQYDVGQSMAYITFQASEEGLVVHQMGGFSKEKARALFHIPENHQPIAMMALGHQDAPESLPEDFQKMEKAARERKPMDQLVFKDSFGRPAF